MSSEPRSESSHTGTTKQGVLSKIFSDLSSVFISTPQKQVPPTQAPLRDVKKVDQNMTMRGVIRRRFRIRRPSNLMAGQPAPRPLSAVPQIPGGNGPGAIQTVPKSVETLPVKAVVIKPVKVLAGTLNIVVPVNKRNKPLLSKIHKVDFIPQAANVAGATPIFNINLKKG